MQPFRQNILTAGEFSFHFFYGEFSHAIQKIPKSGDYRVQEEYGGNIISITPSPEELEIMELELVGPSLYFRTNTMAAAKFANALNRLLAR